MKNLKHFTLAIIFFTGFSSLLVSQTPEEEPTVRVVGRVLPAVVNLKIEGVVHRYFQDFWGRHWREPRNIDALGSGVIITDDGYIVTCAHVVDVEEALKLKILVTLSNEKTYQAKFISSDFDKDLALIKITDEKPLPYLDIRNLSPNLLGQSVIVLGNPQGFKSSVSKGILSAKDRSITIRGGEKAEGLLQTDASINPGNSGGPMVDIAGDFVGISSAKYTGQAIEGIGFAIEGSRVLEFVYEEIAIASGKKKRPKVLSPVEVLKNRFGISLQKITPEIAQAFGLGGVQGLIVSGVKPGSQAEKQGAKEGMLLKRVGNVPVLDIGALPRQISRLKKGDRVTLKLATIEQKGMFTFTQVTPVTLVAE